ncbi:beta-lactamase superfamily metal-dependent hydrolase [Lacticaseibacillus pantheris DSM 15945 = JCM 12539 = NBRC 106106]|uniref:Beta-lactamase superfamily metal-dependent hydrolase n=1 Tax=Lacticaseibacillus pantheris DSM 15945 = JCM 12539 = NBRC 106106 TaxID=1423783 RepID=A0A0R1TWC4_9LACO|nr:MBL fold metallo-hydrolase [Lacticaseibacillus pantheris]KRL85616.1 beta-lactamase superfamily metal-dependent hydrolase [Lacticaseibacillus pantheris DSM 15945 = JCM 12539 = NBRC 106106]
MEIRVLGYYGGYPADGVGTSAYLVTSGDYHLLMDAGSGALLELEPVLDPLQLDAVLLTHYHHDHTADVGTLQYYWQLRPGAKKEPVLPIYGHTKDPLNFAALTFGDFTIGRGYTADSTVDLGPLRLTFLETEHPVPAFAVRIEETTTGKVVVNTSDTRYFGGLAPFSRGADLLLADTNFLADKPAPRWHLTAPEAGKVAADAGVGQLVLTHLPQTVNLHVLQQQAQDAAGDIPVLLASEHPVLRV